MKKLARTILAPMSISSLLLIGSCGNSKGGKAADGSEHLTISWWGNQERNERTKKINDMFMKQNQGVKIDGQFAEWSDYYQKLSVSAAGKTIPDIMQIETSHFQQFKDNNLLLDMGKYIDNKTIDVSHVNKQIVNQGKLDNGMYAITNATNAPALIYDKTLTDSIGITVPNDMTIQQFEDISRQVYQKTGYKTNFQYYEQADLLEYILRGRERILYQKGKLGVKSPAELEPFFKVYEDGIKEGWHLDPKVFTEIKISSVEQDPLVYGTNPSTMSWCTFRYSSQLVAYYRVAPRGDKLAQAPYPSDNVAKSNYLKPSQFWVISKNCKNPDLAAKWINFYINDVNANKILSTERGLPINTKVLEAIKPSLTEPDKESIEYVQKVVTPHSTKINPPVPSGAAEVNSKILPAIEENLCYGKITAKEAAKEFCDQANESLANAR